MTKTISKAKQKNLTAKANRINKIIVAIKSFIESETYLNKELTKPSKTGYIRITDMRGVFKKTNPVMYDDYIYSGSIKYIDFLKFFSNDKYIPISDELDDLKTLMEEKDIDSLCIRREHDAWAISSWNSYWLKIKE